MTNRMLSLKVSHPSLVISLFGVIKDDKRTRARAAGRLECTHRLVQTPAKSLPHVLQVFLLSLDFGSGSFIASTFVLSMALLNHDVCSDSHDDRRRQQCSSDTACLFWCRVTRALAPSGTVRSSCAEANTSDFRPSCKILWRMRLDSSFPSKFLKGFE